MPAYPARLAGLLGLVLLVVLAPAVLPPRRAIAAPVAPAARALPAGLVWGRLAAGPGEVPLGWATFLGGSADDLVTGIAADGQGNVYVTGGTQSDNFPITPGAAQPHLAGHTDAFVASYDARGHLRWATYLGGVGDDHGDAIAADRQGNVYVTGDTQSTDFPVRPGALKPHDYGAFVAAYDTLGRIRWAIFLGGPGRFDYDAGKGITVDGQGNVYVTGFTKDADFPITPGAAQPHLASADDTDAFVASYVARGHLRWATYLGGSDEEDYDGGAIAADGQGNVYVTGGTQSNNFPVTPGAAQPHLGAALATNLFVASYDTQGRLRWATYLGGSDNDHGNGIATDGQGNVYVTGDTQSTDFPISPGAAQPRFGGGDQFGGDAFVVSYDPRGRRRWATYLGGSSSDGGYGLAADRRGNVYVTGGTQSDNFPVTSGAAQTHYSGDWDDVFVAAYDAGGRLHWATFLGGRGDDVGVGIAHDGHGGVYVTGGSGHDFAAHFPVTPGAAQSIFGGPHYDSFVARLLVPGARPVALDPASPPSPGTPNARYFPLTHHTLAGPFLAAWDRLGGIQTLGLPLSEPFTLAGQRVQVTERAVLVLSGGQVSLLPLGHLLSAARSFAPVAPLASTASRLYFPGTGHTLSGPFLAYWQGHQGSALLGPPIAEPDREGLGDGTGRVYLVQWFANGRLELHPEAKDVHYRVQQGRVGYEYLHRAGLL